MIYYHLDITKEELETVLGGISDDGKVSKAAEKILLARIEEGKSQEYPKLEVKRQFRATVSAEEGKKIADAIDKYW